MATRNIYISHLNVLPGKNIVKLYQDEDLILKCDYMVTFIHMNQMPRLP